MKPLIKLPPEWMARARAWAETSVDDYARGAKENSRRYARPGIDKSIPHQMMGKAAECAFCLHLGLDPEILDWSPKPDPGWDVEQFGLRIDVKGSRTPYLIWPVTKNGYLHQCKADIFVLVRQMGASDLYEISGWTTVPYFIELHHVATARDRLDAGTKHMHFSDLPDIAIFCSVLESLKRRQCRVTSEVENRSWQTPKRPTAPSTSATDSIPM